MTIREDYRWMQKLYAVGFTEFSVRRIVDPDKFSFAIPHKVYKEMGRNASDSFLVKGRWNQPSNKQ